jgi:phage head maturation protease
MEEVVDEQITEVKEISVDSNHYCFVRGIELKELEGELFVDGIIATSHVDAIGDRIPRVTLDVWAKEINDGNPSANKASYHHDRRPKVVGVAVKGSAKVVSLPDKEFGLFVRTHVNKTADEFKELKYEVENGFIDGFSIEYFTRDGATTYKELYSGQEVRILGTNTELHGYGFASRPVQKEAIIMSYSYKELRGDIMVEEKIETQKVEEVKEQVVEKVEEVKEVVKDNKEFLELKEKLDVSINQVVERLNKMEVKEQVLKTEVEVKELPLEVKEFKEVIEGKVLDVKEQLARAARMDEKYNLREKGTSRAETREYKSFSTNGRKLEYKSLGITTNQNTDTDYLQSSAELQDVYDPVIYNMLNQATATWNVIAKDNYAGKGNNQVQFTAKIAANTTAAFYTGNAVTTGNVTRLKYQTKFKKLQVGVSIDGDMIAAARGGPVSDVFAQEVADSTMDMLAVLNAALYAEVGLETAAAIIGFEYITDSAGNTTMYSLTRSSTNKLSPDSAGDTYINQASTVISMTNLRSAIKQAVNEGASKRNLVFFTNPVQGNMLRGKFDDARRMLQPTDTGFGFTTDLYIDGIPVFEDKDCNTDDFFLVDLETHRIAIWVPPTIEKLGKTGDSEDAFIKMYLASYNRAPRRMVQIYGCATS